MIRQGEIWWVDLPVPVGAEPGFRRPVIVVQSDPFTESGLRSVVAVPLTSNLSWAGQPGCAALPTSATGLPKDSVAQAFQIRCMDKAWFVAKAGALSAGALEAVFRALDEVLDR